MGKEVLNLRHCLAITFLRRRKQYHSIVLGAGIAEMHLACIYFTSKRTERNPCGNRYLVHIGPAAGGFE